MYVCTGMCACARRVTVVPTRAPRPAVARTRLYDRVRAHTRAWRSCVAKGVPWQKLVRVPTVVAPARARRLTAVVAVRAADALVRSAMRLMGPPAVVLFASEAIGLRREEHVAAAPCGGEQHDCDQRRKQHDRHRHVRVHASPVAAGSGTPTCAAHGVGRAVDRVLRTALVKR